jgi:HK97 gp10 family phage protein
MALIRTDDGMRVQVHVNKADLDDIRQQLDQLSPRLAKRMVRSAFKKAGEFLRDMMRSNAPVLADKTDNKDAIPGELRDSIDFKISTGRSGARGRDANALDRVYMKIGPKWITKKNKTMNPGLYALFVEFGLLAKHYVSKPFARPTFDSGAERALNIIADDLRESLPEIVAKRGTGGRG